MFGVSASVSQQMIISGNNALITVFNTAHRLIICLTTFSNTIKNWYTICETTIYAQDTMAVFTLMEYILWKALHTLLHSQSLINAMTYPSIFVSAACIVLCT